MSRSIFLLLIFLIYGCSSNPQLHTKILAGDTTGAMQLIERREGINHPDKQGYIPLHLAVLQGRIDFVETLIAAGADLNYRSYFSETPLLLACRNKTSDIAKLLVDKGAQINPPYNGINAFSEAVRLGHSDLVRLFVHKGANREVRNHFGETPLFYAVQSGNRDMIQLLIDSGANINAKADDGRSVLHVAALKRSAERKFLVDLILKFGGNIHDAEASEVALFSTAELYFYLGQSALERNDINSGLSYFKKSADYYSRSAHKFEQVAANHHATTERLQQANLLSVALAGITAMGQAHTQAQTMAQVTPPGQTAKGYGFGVYTVRNPERLQALEMAYRTLAKQCKEAHQYLIALAVCLETQPVSLQTCKIKSQWDAELHVASRPSAIMCMAFCWVY